MLTGRRAFRGETEVDTITAVLREDPPEANLEQASIPVPFQQVIRHCTEKSQRTVFSPRAIWHLHWTRWRVLLEDARCARATLAE